jgi:hypothetical protein
MGPRHTRRSQRYRRCRILGLLPGLVMVGGRLSLGLAQQEWLVLVAGAAFLLLCAAMIASDHPAAPRPSRAPSRRRTRAASHSHCLCGATPQLHNRGSYTST